MNRISWVALVQLHQNNHIPKSIIDGWKLYRGRDLDKTIQDWKESERIRKLWIKPLNLLDEIAFPALILGIGSFVGYYTDYHTAFFLSVAIMSIVVFGVGMIGYAVKTIYVKKWQVLSEGDRSFHYRYNDLLEWTKTTPERFSQLTTSELKDMATGLLVVAATKILEYRCLERIVIELSLEYTDVDERILLEQEEFDYKYGVLHDFGLLTRFSVNHYYDAARKNLNTNI